MSVPGLVDMRELGLCQQFSDLSEPSRPDQDDISVRFDLHEAEQTARTVNPHVQLPVRLIHLTGLVIGDPAQRLAGPGRGHL
jgi:hypothetical protein